MTDEAKDGDVAQEEVGEKPKGCLARWRSCLALLVALAIGGYALYYFYLQPLASAMLGCGINLRYSHYGFQLEYAEANDGLYPPLSTNPGEFTYANARAGDDARIYPSSFWCPSTLAPENRKLRRHALDNSPSEFTSDAHYVYLGYRIKNDEQARAFLKTYEEIISLGGNFDDDLTVVSDNGEKVVVERIRETDTYDDELPVVWERGAYHKRGHIYVIYQNGNMEFKKLGTGFPASQWFLDALEELERKYAK